MNKLNNLLLTAGLIVASSSANAIIIDFKYLADHSVAQGGLGERGWTSDLMFDSTGNYTTNVADAFLSISATNGGGSNPYLDAGNAGLGVCGTLTSSLQCNPSSDDNVSFHTPNPEVLYFTFIADVIIENLWMNNNHDGDRSLEDDYVLIDGSGVQLGAADSFGDSLLAVNQHLVAGNSFTVGFDVFDNLVDNGGTCSADGTSFNNCEFYVSKIEYSTAVPEPTILALLALGLAGIGISRKRIQY